jgi:hypothetical protein
VKVESLIFNLIAFLAITAAVVYGLWAQEPIGTTALVLSGALCGLIGGFFWFVSRRIDPRPEDRADAEIAEGAGELGFFSPGSYWPVGLAAAATVVGIGLSFVQVWLVIVGALILLFMVGGLLFEYYIGGRQPLEH